MPAAIVAKFKSAFTVIADGNNAQLDNGQLIVTVFNVGTRGDIYK
jgi:hypothetical protein